MADFSIEAASEQIVDPRTKAYFGEVFSSYSVGNHRSSVVMLWSVVICDLLFKLEDLKSRGDPAAQQISLEIDAKRASNPNSPEWELALLQRVKEKTHLIEVAEFVNLTSLQQHRHLCAHPVISNATYELFSPNRETARAHIRNALEAVLTKSAFMSKKVFDAFVEDLERLSSVVQIHDAGDTSLRRYLEATYFQRLSPPVAESIFRSLWKLVFKNDDTRCNANRSTNLRALRLLFGRNETRLLNLVTADSAHYSDVAVAGGQLEALVWFLSLHPRVYAALTDAARVPLKSHLDRNSEQFALAWFVANDLRSHIESIQARATTGNVKISRETFEFLYNLAKEHNVAGLLRAFSINRYITAASFDAADARFENVLAPCLGDFDSNELVALLNGIEQNSQTYGRGRADADHVAIKGAIERVFGTEFDLGSYPKFKSSLE